MILKLKKMTLLLSVGSTFVTSKLLVLFCAAAKSRTRRVNRRVNESMMAVLRPGRPEKEAERADEQTDAGNEGE